MCSNGYCGPVLAAGGGGTDLDLRFSRGQAPAQLATDPAPAAMPEPTGFPAQLLAGNDPATLQKGLERGSFRIRFKVKVPASVTTPYDIRNQETQVQLENERKRIYVHRVEVVPLDQVSDDGQTRIAQATATVTLVDNPLPVALVLLAVTAVGTPVAGWFFLDKIEEFTQSGIGQFTIVAASVLGVVFTLLALKKA